MKGAMGFGAMATMPGLLSACGGSTEPSAAKKKELQPWLAADIDWRQAAGTTITALVTPAHYFEKFQSFTKDFFTALTGINVHFEVIPPKQLRKKAMLDLGSGTGKYATHSGDPMYVSLYESNGWVDPLEDYLGDSSLTNAKWFDVDDIIPAWRASDSVNDELYAMPVAGEVTIHIYRSDVFEKLGLKPPETLQEFSETARAADSSKHAGLALRGFQGAGQNMYIFPSLFKEFGAEWFDSAGNPSVNSEASIKALQYYVDNLQQYGPPGVKNMNWPQIMSAFADGGITQYVDANSTASVIENPGKSKVAGEVGYGRWPKGPTGKRVSSIWNWAMPINAALSEQEKKATWLFLQFLASRPTQLQSATYGGKEAVKRTGVNRLSIWEDPAYREDVGFTDDYVDVVLTSLREDTDPSWRPSIPEWPEIGETMAIAVQRALTNQGSPEENLNEANTKIAQIMNG